MSRANLQRILGSGINGQKAVVLIASLILNLFYWHVLFIYCLILFKKLQQHFIHNKIGFVIQKNLQQAKCSFRLQQSDASAFSPDLYGGNVKNPGIKIKLNQKGFARAGKVVGDIVDKEIRTTRLPLLRQCIPQVLFTRTVPHILTVK